MKENEPVYLQGDLVEEHVEFSAIELCRITGASRDDLARWVEEGAFEPQGARFEEWRFRGTCLRRAITAQRLATDLELNAPGVALALDLLDQIDALRTRLARLGDSADTFDAA